ncbi:MAG: phosphoglycolate phosphatase [Alphaproteobacteria bacterium]|nr:phosphoglycolate phosphatase [Alphaproteobacteria bacterium]
MPSRRHTLLFDLDGTLIDTAPDLAAAVNAVLASLDRPALPLASIRAYLGEGARRLIERGLAATGGTPGAPEFERLIAQFFAHYEANLTRASRPFVGVTETLAVLTPQAGPFAVCTNKPGALSARLLTELGLAHYFGVMLGGDNLPVRKPDPGHLLTAIARLGRTPADAVMVGDSSIDVAAARGAGIAVVVVGYGYSREPAAALGADAVIERFADLPAALAALP